MAEPLMVLSQTFQNFVRSEKAGGLLLVACTALAMALANSPAGPGIADLWREVYLGLSLEHWINDALMAVFFLFVGLELERELHNGELSDWRNAVLPVVAALGGAIVPAAIHLSLNTGTPTQDGAGIPMATDIAFALGVLALVGNRVPLSLRIFLTALAVIDDLLAIVVIAVFYTHTLQLNWLLGALVVFVGLLLLNQRRVMALWPYLLGGAFLWWLMLKSGIHPTLAGVMLAFAIPFSARAEDETSPSHRLEDFLHRPVAFLVLPLFALANTGLVIGVGWTAGLVSANGLGIIGGLALGKPLGIVLASLLAIRLGWSRMPADLTWRHLLGAGLLGGIGFTMAIFIANLAFSGRPELVDGSKMAILAGSLASGLAGWLWLRFACATAVTKPA
jgi:Na+:H+ antiporter, NhaA family